MKKTARQWFEMAKVGGHEWADEALELSREAGTLDDYCPSLHEAISSGFNWPNDEIEKWDAISISAFEGRIDLIPKRLVATTELRWTQIEKSLWGDPNKSNFKNENGFRMKLQQLWSDGEWRDVPTAQFNESKKNT